MGISIGIIIGSWIKTLINPNRGVRDIVSIRSNLLEGVFAVIFTAIIAGIISLIGLISFKVPIGVALASLVVSVIMAVIFMLILGVVYIVLSILFGARGGNAQSFLPSFGFVFSAFLIPGAIIGLFVGIPIVVTVLSLFLLVYFVLIVANLLRLIFGLNSGKSLIVAAIPPVVLLIVSAVLFGSLLFAFGSANIMIPASNLTNETIAGPDEQLAKLCVPGDVKEVNGISVFIHGLKEYQGRTLCYATAGGGALAAYGNVEIYLNVTNPADYIILVNGQEYPLNTVPTP